MKSNLLKSVLFLAVISFTLPSCLKDLNQTPFYGVNEATVYANPANYIHVLAKLYGALAITGDQGPAGQPDLTPTSVYDEGSSGLLRSMYNMQELSTDESVCCWNDAGIPDLHYMTWNSQNKWVLFTYDRIYFMESLCNEFIRASSDSAIAGHGFDGSDASQIKVYNAEARFLRALGYYYALDLFGSVSFVTEKDGVGSYFPPQISRVNLFNYIESELKAIDPLLTPAHQAVYGHADQAADWALLARLYLNAGVYTGTTRYTDCITYCNKIISAGYSLDPSYPHLFEADNNTSPEMIFPVVYSGAYTQTYGGTTFLVHSAAGGKISTSAVGIQSGSAWAGYRVTPEFASKFYTIP
jgi:starch-binding outer membrane protein, SusD/RagB family